MLSHNTHQQSPAIQVRLQIGTLYNCITDTLLEYECRCMSNATLVMMSFCRSRTYQKGHRLKTITEKKLSWGQGRSNLAPILSIRSISSLPPQKYLKSLPPSHPAFSAFMRLRRHSQSTLPCLRKHYFLCLCCELQNATYTRKEKVAQAAKLSIFLVQ